jgi:hypothetical protein
MLFALESSFIETSKENSHSGQLKSSSTSSNKESKFKDIHTPFI